MSALDFCRNCSGHGSTFRTVTVDVPGLTAVMRKRVAQGRPAVLAVPCTACDGQDRATPYHESLAEEGTE
ncbi:hypothetical protein RFN58_07150 [Streptomyces iakyrus]|uniref:hypothetical protein n=1 Tax=Streptomyces iakyrus TaxID=68219 RepID=UPI000526DA98|nr:hypothetical protein [Streptomyces iakyrus]